MGFFPCFVMPHSSNHPTRKRGESLKSSSLHLALHPASTGFSLPLRLRGGNHLRHVAISVSFSHILLFPHNPFLLRFFIYFIYLFFLYKKFVYFYTNFLNMIHLFSHFLILTLKNIIDIFSTLFFSPHMFFFILSLQIIHLFSQNILCSFIYVFMIHFCLKRFSTLIASCFIKKNSQRIFLQYAFFKI